MDALFFWVNYSQCDVNHTMSCFNIANEDVHIKTPKKKSTYYSCKIVHRGNKLILTLENAHVLSLQYINGVTYMRLKLTRKQQRGVAEIEAMLIDIIKPQMTGWFGSKIDDSFVDEFFSFSTAVDKKHGAYTLVRIQDKNEELLDITPIVTGCSYNLEVQITHVKIMKQCVQLISDVKHFEAVSQRWIGNQDDDGDGDDDGDDDIDIDPEQVIEARHTLLAKYRDTVEIVAKTISLEVKKLETLRGKVSLLEDDSVDLGIKTLDALYDDLNDEYFLN